MKKTICLLISLLIVFACSCTNRESADSSLTPTDPPSNSPTTLEIPVPSYENGIVSWDKIEGATKYEVVINNELITTYDNKLTLTVTNTPVEYNIKIKAISENPNRLNSEFSDSLIFKTCYIPSVTFGIPNYVTDSPLSNDRTQVEIPINKNGIDYYTLYINDTFIEESNSDILTLYCTQFEEGYNTVEIYSYTKYQYDIDGKKQTFIVYRNPDYQSVRFESGQIVYTNSLGVEAIYDTSMFSIGSAYRTIRNNEIPADPQILISFSSSGVAFFDLYKINTPIIESCTYTDVVPYKKGSIQLKLRNFNPDFMQEDYYKLGFDFDTVEVTIYDDFGEVTTLSQIVNRGDYYTDCIFDFDILHPFGYIREVSVQLKKDGYLSSEKSTYKLKISF